MKNFKAFTLAEILITLGIIGVVAALTLPPLMHAYKAKRLRTQFLKTYSIIQQTFKQIEADDLSINPSDYPLRTFYKTFITYLNGATDCGYSGSLKNICFNISQANAGQIPQYKTLSNKQMSNTDFDDGQIALPDGTLLLFENPNNQRILVYSDINGVKTPPNKLGYDLFAFQFMDGELKTVGSTGTQYSNITQYCNLESTSNRNGMACAHLAKTDSEYFKWAVKNIK
ncbi:MAG: type II secretion system GspH family protein [Muribaculaceae bacterium]|nr:type II secretion system GspH family protein [Muribaculaceae bacterium]